MCVCWTVWAEGGAKSKKEMQLGAAERTVDQ